MLQLLAIVVNNILTSQIGKYYFGSLVRPAFKLDQGQNFVSPDRVEGLEVVIKPLGPVRVDGLLRGARLTYQADILLIQHDISATSDAATEALIQGLLTQRVKVVAVIPIRRQIGLDSLDQTRLKVEYYETITDRSKIDGYFSQTRPNAG